MVDIVNWLSANTALVLAIIITVITVCIIVLLRKSARKVKVSPIKPVANKTKSKVEAIKPIADPRVTDPNEVENSDVIVLE